MPGNSSGRQKDYRKIGRKMKEENKQKKQKGDSNGPVVYHWREKINNREEMLKYLKTADRYWYSDDWFGSEKRKNPA